jgi:hypothetical protein
MMVTVPVMVSVLVTDPVPGKVTVSVLVTDLVTAPVPAAGTVTVTVPGKEYAN